MFKKSSLIDLKLQQFKKFLKERKKNLKRKYFKKLVDEKNDVPINSK